MVIQWADAEVYDKVIKDPRYTSETRTVNLLEPWSEEVCARIRWEAPVVQDIKEQQPVKKKVHFEDKRKEGSKEVKEDSEVTDDDDVKITKAVKHPRRAKKPKIEVEKEEEKPKLKAETLPQAVTPSNAPGLGKFFFCLLSAPLSALCPHLSAFIRICPHLSAFVRICPHLSALYPHCIRT